MKQITENIVVRCKTSNEAKIVCNFLHSIGYKWNGGDDSLLNNPLWGTDRYGTIYHIYFKDKTVCYSNGSRTESEDCLSFNDFSKKYMKTRIRNMRI